MPAPPAVTHKGFEGRLVLGGDAFLDGVLAGGDDFAAKDEVIDILEGIALGHLFFQGEDALLEKEAAHRHHRGNVDVLLTIYLLVNDGDAHEVVVVARGNDLAEDAVHLEECGGVNLYTNYVLDVGAANLVVVVEEVEGAVVEGEVDACRGVAPERLVDAGFLKLGIDDGILAATKFLKLLGAERSKKGICKKRKKEN